MLKTTFDSIMLLLTHYLNEDGKSAHIYKVSVDDVS